MTSTSTRLLAALALVTCTSGAAHAVVLVPLSRATFQAAISGVTTLGVQNFDALPAGSTLTTDGTVTYASSTGTPLVTNSYLTSTAPNGLGRTGLGYFLPSDTVTLSFLNPITAFGIDINTFATTNGAFSVLLNTGDTANSISESFPRGGTGQFIGFTSSTPFSSLVLSSKAGFSFTLDTLIYGDKAQVAAGVPEPATWLMMILGFGAIGFAVRRAHKRAVPQPG